MSIEVSTARRASTALTWPLGIAMTSWHYLWRILPVHRSEGDGSVDVDLPPALPEDVSHAELQLPRDGFGPLLHRTYHCTIADSCMSAEELMRELSANPDRVAPWRLARFRKTHGAPGKMAQGDEFLVHMPGPWDGPVRAIDVRPDRFRFATLAGHLEAGQIEWRAWEDERLHFAVESWSRGGDRFSAFLHDRVRMAKEVQLYMWTSVVERVPKLAGGRLLDGVHVETRRVPTKTFEAAAP
jgi:hypothetical protein